MNGRALNEKAIEVSPSSSRVLDRASDILTPFPPSKNRPRPGDWTCPSCGFSNFQRRTACFRCSYPAMGDQSHQMYGGYGYGHPGMMPHPGHHMNHGHGSMHGGMGRGGGESRVPFRAGDWRCGADGCNYHNFAKNVSCLRCGASRATAAMGAVEVPGMDGHGSYGMHHGMGGPGQYGGAPSGYGSAGGYPGQGFGGPPSSYGMPSAIGGGPAPYGHMGSGYGPSTGGQSGGFDSRAESAFSSAGPNSTSSFANGNSSYSATDSAHDPFNFLSSGLSNLSMGPGAEGNARNGAGTSKSPA